MFFGCAPDRRSFKALTLSIEGLTGCSSVPVSIGATPSPFLGAWANVRPSLPSHESATFEGIIMLLEVEAIPSLVAVIRGLLSVAKPLAAADWEPLPDGTTPLLGFMHYLLKELYSKMLARSLPTKWSFSTARSLTLCMRKPGTSGTTSAPDIARASVTAFTIADRLPSPTTTSLHVHFRLRAPRESLALFSPGPGEAHLVVAMVQYDGYLTNPLKAQAPSPAKYTARYIQLLLAVYRLSNSSAPLPAPPALHERQHHHACRQPPSETKARIESAALRHVRVFPEAYMEACMRDYQTILSVMSLGGDAGVHEWTVWFHGDAMAIMGRGRLVKCASAKGMSRTWLTVRSTRHIERPSQRIRSTSATNAKRRKFTTFWRLHREHSDLALRNHPFIISFPHGGPCTAGNTRYLHHGSSRYVHDGLEVFYALWLFSVPQTVVATSFPPGRYLVNLLMEGELSHKTRYAGDTRTANRLVIYANPILVPGKKNARFQPAAKTNFFLLPSVTRASII
ncbi:hypothetical protein V8D89_008920 [Ganoderma adspersum]